MSSIRQKNSAMDNLQKPLNVIYVCTSSSLWREIATQLKNDYGFIPKFHVGFEKKQTTNPEDIFYGIPFYNINEARKGDIPATIPDLKFADHNINMFTDLQNDFDSFLEMCERFVIDTSGGSLEQKKNFFLHLINLWTGILNHTKAEVVVIGSRPHRMFDLVLEFLCKKHNLPIIMLEETNMNDCVYAVDLRNGLSFPFDTNDLKKPPLKVSEEAKEFIRNKQSNYTDAKPLYMSLNGFFSEERQKREHGLLFKFKKKIPPAIILCWSLFKSLVRGNLFEPLPTMIKFSTTNEYDYKPITPNKVDLIFQTYRRQKQIKYAADFYNANAVKADLSKKYIYYSASYQPERSTCPDAGRYHDMLLSLSALSNSINDDTIIYYKEHPRTLAMPADFDAQRALWFYQEVLNKLQNVVFIDNNYSPFDLIDNAYCVAMTSGSTAVESAARGKYCILFGDRWFSNFPGIIRCYSKNDVKNALNTIDNSTIKKADIYQYLAMLEDYSDDISYIFESNVNFRKDIERKISEDVSENELELNKINGERAARQIYRAANLN